MASATVPAGPLVRELPIGPGDNGDLTVFGIPEMSQHFHVDAGGNIKLPLLGAVQVAGLTAPQAEALIAKKYEDGGFLKNPQIDIFIKESNSQVTTVLGEVNRPGTYSLSQARRLYDVFQLAGGLTQKAGNKVSISHPGASTAVTYTLSKDPVQMATTNIELQPGDTIAVSTAGIVYVVGEVMRPGGFVLENGNEPTISELMGMAAGPTRVANLSHARLIRKTPSGLESKEVNIKKVLTAKADDFQLQPNDILLIPSSKTKMAFSNSSSLVTSLATMAIYRF